MRLSEIYIERYGPLPRFTHSCEGNIDVFYGPNESGKTLILEAILRQLAPDIGAVMDGIGRVRDDPSGHVVVESNGADHRIGGETSLGDLWELTPRHLRNVFVIRDSDLSLLHEHDFYDSVTRRIGNLHTSEIEAIQSRLVDVGRLTSLEGRELSAAAANDDAADIRDEAAALATEIRRYIDDAETAEIDDAETAEIDDAETAEIDDAERELITVRSELTLRREELDRQLSAKARATHHTLSQRLETYETAVTEIDRSVSPETLEELEDGERAVSRSTTEIRELEAERERLADKRAELVKTRDRIDAEVAPLEDRQRDIETVEDALEQFRENRRRTLESSNRESVAKAVAVLGLGLGGGAALLGETLVGGALVALGVLGLVWVIYLLRASHRVAGERMDLCASARDAGLDVDRVEAIAPAIQRFTDDLSRRKRRRRSVEQRIELLDEQISNRESELDEARETRRRSKSRIQSLLDESGFTDVGAYRSRVQTNAELRQAKREARRSLVDSLGEPTDESPTDETRIAYWGDELEALVADVPTDVSHTEHDPERIASLEGEVDDLETRRNALREQLDQHQRRLTEFADRLQEIPATRFRSESIGLSARSLDGLRAAAKSLDDLVARIERDADTAREALSVFDELREEEEQKLRTLFGDDSRATDVFGQITDDRYRGVEYDAARRELLVHRGDGTALSPTELSHGTRDQLYLAARVGLAEQLLGSEPGFFLMDDAFLPADRDRLQTAFTVLQELAAEGWQILYFTAKDEVGVDMVESRNLRCRTLSQLP